MSSSRKMKVVSLLSLISLALCFTVGAASQEPVEFLTLHDPNENGLSVAVQLENEQLKNVSSSVLMAESWVRAHILSVFPASNVSTILIGNSVFCDKDEENKLSLVLPCVKNIHYSLTRWGLHNDIKVSVPFTSQCLDLKSETYREHLSEKFIKPLLNTLQEMSSPYVVNLNTFSDEILKPHLESTRKLGVSHFENIKVIKSSRNEKPFGRKLSFLDSSSLIGPFPIRPTPISPSQGPSGHSSPAYAAASPLPPLIGTVSPDSSAPSLPPLMEPTTPPFQPHWAPMATPPSFGPHLPPCAPAPSEGGSGGSVGSPLPGPTHNGLWCVAKPNVPPETLQEALDYACGEGGADCGAIGPHGSCYYPDTVVAHASFAFNSYWQKNKKNGGTCEFGGTAMLINSDPSYRHCRFILT